MKKENVPQDKSSLSDKNIRELYYAVDQEGKYTTALSTGWTPKTIVQEATLELLEQRIQQAQTDVKKGLVSPVVYFMEVHRMDWATLAAYMNQWVWTTKRHAKPRVFKKLKPKILQKYASVFQISVEELVHFNGESCN